MTQEVTKADLENIRLGNKADIAKIEKLIAETNQTSSEGRPAPPSPPTTAPDGEPSIVKADLEELKIYRENERQALLKKLPKKVIEQFKLKEESLARVKEIGTLTAALKKRDVGIDTPTTDTTIKEKKFQWNPDTLKNEMC